MNPSRKNSTRKYSHWNDLAWLLQLFVLFWAFGGLATCIGCVGGNSSVLDEERRRELDTYWDLYQLDDPGWPEIRQRWYAYGGPEREVLVLSLVRDLIRLAPSHVTVGGSPEPAWRRPQRELLALGGEATIPVLVEALRIGRDTASLAPLSDTLAGLGAVDELAELLENPREDDSAASRPFVMKALVRAGGQRAIDRVGSVLFGDPEWSQRASAADALASARYSDRKPALAALARAYADPDAFVVKRAVLATAQVAETAAAPRLVRLARVYQQAAEQKDQQAAEETLAELRSLVGETVGGEDSETWKSPAEQTPSNPR